ncbi:MAG TPA: hypothetical protein IAC95_03355 [Candidatus Fimimonas gallinarum]|uniref:Uncharacterized protein n=1 Tax=Candidatus Fimimonas gallinarum TaxID=2840821 RepID=A0A9D1E425_9BACT|nr:hypothetical protein [Candidatus Fimimonas gallinarum]
MTQKRKLVSKLFVAVVVLTLVSCCFLASTFARYTSGGSGTGTVEVATWKVTGEGAGQINAQFKQLSPSKDAYDNTPRKHSTAPVLVATITYEIDVNGILTLTASEETITKTAADADWGTYDEEEIKGLFDIQLYLSDAKANNVESLKGKEVASGAKTPVTAGSSGTYYVYAVVTWTSDDETVYGEPADKRDTWVGTNVTSVGYELSYTFVQDSEAPNA